MYKFHCVRYDGIGKECDQNLGLDFCQTTAILCHVGYVISRVAWLSTWGHAVGLGQAPKSDITCDEAAAFPGEREVELCDGLNGRLGKEMVGLVGSRQRFASLRQG